MATDSDSSDSENDEHLKKLVEATDVEFFNDSLYKNESNSHQEPKNDAPLPSQRRNQDDDEDYNFFKVTPGFRKYVAKNLDKRIEQSIEYTESNKRIKRKRKTSGGVRLFRDSGDYLTAEDESEHSTADFNKSRKRALAKKPSDVNSAIDEAEKVRSVAVSPEDILNQKGTENWTYKNKLYKYKKSKDGTLVSIDS